MIKKLKLLIYNFLLKSQKITGTDNVYIAKHGFYLIAGQFVSVIAAILSSVAFARLLPKETYGNYQYILSIMSILAIAALDGINKSVVQGVARGFEGALKEGFRVKLKWGLFGSIASIAIAIYFWFNGNIEFTVSFLIIAVFMPLFKSGEIYQSYLDGKKLFGKRVAYTTLVQVISTILLFVALLFTKSLIVLILVYFVSYTGLRLFFIFLVIKKERPKNENDPQIISYGKHLSLMGIVGLIAQQIDKILLFYFVGPIQLAIYSFATIPVEYLTSSLQSIGEIALPKFSTSSKEKIKQTLPKKLLLSIILIILIILIYIIVAPYLYKIFFPQYMNSVFYSRLFSLSLLVFPITMLRVSLQSQMMTKELYKISIASPVILIILLSVLTPLYGILGVVIARLLSHVFYFFLAWIPFKKM